ncbi:hypothetical protein GCM10010398_03880 [Streptomyces fimbriatus]
MRVPDAAWWAAGHASAPRPVRARRRLATAPQKQIRGFAAKVPFTTRGRMSGGAVARAGGRGARVGAAAAGSAGAPWLRSCFVRDPRHVGWFTVLVTDRARSLTEGEGRR